MKSILNKIVRRLVLDAKPETIAHPINVSGIGSFNGKIAKKHPWARCGNSILDKAFGIEFRVDRTDVCVEIGDDCILKCKIIFETNTGHVSIGNGCYIGSVKFISAESIKIGNWVTMAWGITVYDHNSHSLDYRERINDQKQQLADWGSGNFIKNKNWAVVDKKAVSIGDYVWVGFDAVVLKGVTIGEGAVVAARSVVTKDVEPWTVVAGNPARVVKRLPPVTQIEK